MQDHVGGGGVDLKEGGREGGREGSVSSLNFFRREGGREGGKEGCVVCVCVVVSVKPQN